MQQKNIQDLDVLHMDIDGAEVYALQGAQESLAAKKIDTVYILTHYRTKVRIGCRAVDETHEWCAEFMDSMGYHCYKNHPEKTIGGDGLLIYTREK